MRTIKQLLALNLLPDEIDMSAEAFVKNRFPSAILQTHDTSWRILDVYHTRPAKIIGSSAECADLAWENAAVIIIEGFKP